MPRLYEDRKYLNDARTGEHLSTTVMYDGDERIEGTGKALERLRIAIPIIALKLGGKDLGISGHFNHISKDSAIGACRAKSAF